MFTPAVSVTSAVGGIAIAKPSVVKDITGISIVIFHLFVILSHSELFLDIPATLVFYTTIRNSKTFIHILSKWVIFDLLSINAHNFLRSFFHLVPPLDGNRHIQYHILPGNFPCV